MRPAEITVSYRSATTRVLTVSSSTTDEDSHTDYSDFGEDPPTHITVTWEDGTMSEYEGWSDVPKRVRQAWDRYHAGTTVTTDKEEA